MGHGTPKYPPYYFRLGIDATTRQDTPFGIRLRQRRQMAGRLGTDSDNRRPDRTNKYGQGKARKGRTGQWTYHLR